MATVLDQVTLHTASSVRSGPILAVPHAQSQTGWVAKEGLWSTTALRERWHPTASWESAKAKGSSSDDEASWECCRLSHSLCKYFLIPLSQQPHDAIHHPHSTNEATAQKLSDLAKGTELGSGSARNQACESMRSSAQGAAR